VTQGAPSGSTYLGLGTVIALIILICMGLGWFLDGRAHTAPIFVLVGIGVGVILAAIYSYFKLRRFLKD
jgi:F0F1-type ATP synthase assembly protein I